MINFPNYLIPQNVMSYSEYQIDYSCELVKSSLLIPYDIFIFHM